MISKGQSNFIKLVALCAMLLDHIGAFLCPSLVALRLIGRIAFPIFAYQLTIGYAMASNKKEYFAHLLGFGLIAQIPYCFLAEEFQLNILFALALGVFAFWALEQKKYYCFFLIVPPFFFLKYSVYGLSVLLIFYIFKNKLVQFALFAPATFLYALYLSQPIQIFSLFAFLFIARPFLEIRLPRRFFYVFFPAHLSVILLIRIVFFDV